MKLAFQVMPILFRRKRRGGYVALARPSEYASIRAMRIFALFLFGYLALFAGTPPSAIAQDMNAIQRLYQQNRVGNIPPPPPVSAPSTQRRAVAAPAPRTATVSAPPPVRRSRPPPPVVRSKPPPPVTRSNPAPRPNPAPVAPVAKEAVPQYRGTPPRGLPVSGAKPTESRAATSAPKGPVPVKPKELTVRERKYLAHASRLDQEAGELWWQRRYVDVEYRYREALRYREAVLGRTHPDVAHSLIRLARLYWGSNRNQEAAALHRRALNILEHRLGAESVELANAFWEYGGFLQLRGDYAGAEPLMAKALKVLEKDPDSQRNISRRRTTYATVLSELGRSEEAARILRR